MATNHQTFKQWVVCFMATFIKTYPLWRKIKIMLRKLLSKFLQENKTIHNIFGEFKIGGQLGEGGTSSVREAFLDTKAYAIKFLFENIHEKKSKVFKRFMQAYINISEIQHTAVVLPQIHIDKIQIDKTTVLPYVIMPKAKMTLKDWSKDNELSFDMFEKLFIDILKIVDTIHYHEIIHRDIKPENFFFVEKKLVLGDFDIAKFDDPSHVKFIETKEKERLANFSFSAPEQSQPYLKFNEITKQADWFAVGQVLYWLITGDIIRGQGVRRLSSYDKRYEKYQFVIEKLLAQNPQDRFATKREIESYLEEQKRRGSGLRWDDGLFEFEDNIIDKYTLGKQGFSQFYDQDDINHIMNDLSRLNRLLLDKGNPEVDDVRLWWTQGGTNNALNDSIKKISLELNVWKIGYIEMNIKSVWIFKHFSGFGGSCIILETDHMEPSGLYEYSEDAGDEELAVYGNKKISRTEYDSGWAIIDNKRVKITGNVEFRRRVFKPTLFFIAPFQTSIHDQMSDEALTKILKEYHRQSEVTVELLEPIEHLRRREKVLMSD